MNNTIKNDEKFFKKIIKKQLFMTVITSLFLLFIIIGSSYAVFNDKVETGLTDVIVQSGNLIANISSTSETIELNYTTLGVSNEVGLSYEPYTFTVTNNGDAKIAYYELRIVDKEHEISTLPHKAINYVISKNGGDYTEPQNLGDNRSYIYVGGSLEPGKSDTFDLKMWVNEQFGKYANNKEINASIEITLYSDIPIRNYINYDTQGGNYIPKTNIASKRVTNQVPTKEGYAFAGWSTTPNGEVVYESNAIYDGNNGITLYAVWKVPKSVAETIIEKVVPYNISLPTTFTGGLVGINTDGTLYNENDTTQEIKEYRYSGQEVDNYIYFNCKDNDGIYNYGDENYNYNETNCELWRIVGIFKNSAGKWNLKIMRNTVLQSSELVSEYTIDGITHYIQGIDENTVVWDSRGSVMGSEVMDWTISGIQYFLNTKQDSIGTNGYYSTISSSSESLIDARYEYRLGMVDVYYDTTVISYNNEHDETNVIFDDKPSWNGVIGLLYPSDVGYSAHSSYWGETLLCDYSGSAIKATSWMQQTANHSSVEWLFSPSVFEINVVIWLQDGSLDEIPGYYYHGARPVTNLKSNIYFLDGIEQDGSIDKPYIIISK